MPKHTITTRGANESGLGEERDLEAASLDAVGNDESGDAAEYAVGVPLRRYGGLPLRRHQKPLPPCPLAVAASLGLRFLQFCCFTATDQLLPLFGFQLSRGMAFGQRKNFHLLYKFIFKK